MSQDVTVSVAPRIPLPEVGTIDDVATALGISKRTISRWIRRAHDRLPHARPGGRRLIFTRAAVLAWLARQEMNAAAPRKAKSRSRQAARAHEK